MTKRGSRQKESVRKIGKGMARRWETNIFRAGMSRKKESYVRKERKRIDVWRIKAWKGIWYYYEDTKKCTCSNGLRWCVQWVD